MKHCWNCGYELEREDAKFCTECGTNLASTTSASTIQASVREPEKPEERTPNDEIEYEKLTIQDLGRRLEYSVAEIFKHMGYQAETRHHFTQEGGAEIDVLLKRGNKRMAVECKNYDESREVGIKELRDFKGKLEQIGIVTGIFVATTFFSQPAKDYADAKEIELWDKNKLHEKYFAYFTGRGLTVAKTLLTLALKQDFLSASTIPIRNLQSIKLVSAALLYHPFHVVKYRVYGTRKDPTGKVHKIVDEGVCIVDALDGDVTNRDQSLIGALGGLFQSKEKRSESKEDKVVSHDLLSLYPSESTIAKSSDYEVKILEVAVTEEIAKKVTRDYVIKKNTRTVHYTPKVSKSDDFLTDVRSMQIVPRESEVSFRGQVVVNVPKWDLRYEAGQRSYEKRSVASSGTLIEDDLEKCRKCSVMRKATCAVCDVCGIALCEKHSNEEGGGLLCEDHVSNELREEIKGRGFLSKFKLGRG